MSARGFFTTGLTVAVEDGDGEHGAKAVIEYTFEKGTPESGSRGPPEFYDPGSADEVAIERIVIADEPSPRWLIALLQKDEELLAAIAREHVEGAAAALADRQYQERKDDRMETA